ncbi:MAG: DoxX family membrane protein [Actinomycetia bacterium]|nr:DoxX family membrane protein [Actinomycetes bacterium]
MFLIRTTYLIALVLAAVFAFAGSAKLRQRASTADSFRDFGLPFPRAMSVAVPVLELGLAAGLVLAPGIAAPATVVVLAFFTTLLVGRLRAGITTDCGCFGQASTAPLSRTDVYRNLALMIGAVLASFAQPTLPGPLPLAVAAFTMGTVSVVVARTRTPTLTGPPPAKAPTPGSSS